MNYAERMTAQDSAVAPSPGKTIVFNVVPVEDAVKLAQEADARIAALEAQVAEGREERERLLSGDWHVCHTQDSGEWTHSVRKWPTVACSMCRGQAYSESKVLAEARGRIEALLGVIHGAWNPAVAEAARKFLEATK